MIKFDFNTYVDKFISDDIRVNYLNKKNEIISRFLECNMIGWTKNIDNNLVEKVVRVSEKIKRRSSCLVVIGIGGSFLGSYAVKEMMSKYFDNNQFEVIYAGTTLSSQYMDELLKYLWGIDFTVNVISKSGTTMETTITYNLIKDLMKKKYSKEEMCERIIVTTDEVNGSLREEVLEEGYESFVIPNDIGGRYSIVTAAHLLPLACNIDVEEFVRGLNSGRRYLDEAYNYAVVRKCLFDIGKVVENYVVYEEKMSYFTEWLKQLFGESEGKNGVGILPTSTVHTRDLHSLGQFVQDGNKIQFETFFKVRESNYLEYKNTNLHSINNVVLDSVLKAHYLGNVACNVIELEKVSEFSIGEVMYFFMLSAAFSSLLFDVNPFNQPGVEVYKSEVKNNLVLD